MRILFLPVLLTVLSCSSSDGDPDGDRFGTKLDCDQESADVNPDATEVCGNGIDEDCSGFDALCASELDGWSLSSSKPSAGATAGTITGGFVFKRLDAASAETRSGGACLVADLHGAVPCAADAECTTPPGGMPTGGFGYCLSPDGSGLPKTCWVRPGAQSAYCSVGPGRLPGAYALPTVSGRKRPDDASSTRWVIIGCLASAAVPAACATGDAASYVRSVGPVYDWAP